MASLIRAAACAGLLLQSTVVHALPTGAPTYACAADFPYPHGTPVESNNVVITLTDPTTKQAVSQYTEGVPLDIQITAQDSAVHYGLLLVAYYSDGTTYVSNAFKASSPDIEVLSCDDSVPSSMATQTYDSVNNGVKTWNLQLTPSADFKGDEISLYATIVLKSADNETRGDKVQRSVMKLSPATSSAVASAPSVSVPAPTAAVTSSSAAPSTTTTTYDNTQTIDDKMTLYYSIRGSDIDVKAEYKGTPSWLGVGFSQSGGMVDSDVVIGEVQSLTATPRRTMGYSLDEIPVVNAANVVNPTVSVSNGMTVITFTRPLVPSNSRRQSGENWMTSLSTSGPSNFLYAFGDTPTFDYHGPGKYGSNTFTLKSSTATGPTPVTAPTSQGAGQPSTTSNYDNTEVIDDRMTLMYSIRGDELNVKTVYKGQLGWLGVGFSENGGMIDSDVIIGESSTNTATPRRIMGFDDDEMPQVNSNDVKDATFAVDADGNTVITFSRPMVPANAKSGSRRQASANFMTILSTASPANFLYAFGNSPTFSYHGGGNYGQKSVALSASALGTTPPVTMSSSTTAVPSTTSAPISTSQGVKNPDSAYDFTVPINDQVQVSYSVRSTEVDVKAVLLNKKAGWFGVGFGDSPGKMTDSDVVVGQSQDMSASPRRISSYSYAGVAPVDTNAISNQQFYYDNQGNTVISFTRPLAAGVSGSARRQASNTYQTTLSATDPANFIYAFGSSPTLSSHSPSDKGAATFAFTSGSAQAVSSSTNAKIIAHGALMFIAWGILTPIAIYFAAFSKAFFRNVNQPAGWFHAHRYLQVLSLLCMIAGVALAIVMYNENHYDAGTHKILGIITLCLAFLQPLNAFIRPHPAAPGAPKETKRLIWEILHRSTGWIACILGVVTMGLGMYLQIAGVSTILKGLFWAWIAILVLAAFPLWWWSKQCEKKTKQSSANLAKDSPATLTTVNSGAELLSTSANRKKSLTSETQESVSGLNGYQV